jgi:hypothetical protein
MKKKKISSAVKEIIVVFFFSFLLSPIDDDTCLKQRASAWKLDGADCSVTSGLCMRLTIESKAKNKTKSGVTSTHRQVTVQYVGVVVKTEITNIRNASNTLTCRREKSTRFSFEIFKCS